MPRLNMFQKKRMQERDELILQLAEQGYKLKEIVQIVQEKYRYPISLQRAHQIIQTQLSKEK